MSRAFAITWDYRCPFARIAHDHVLTGLAAGADWDVQFLPFSLSQAHVTEGMPDVWDAPESDSGLVALQAAVVVRDRYPDQFLDVHRALFELRHDHGGSLRDRDVVGKVLEEHDVDAAKVWGEVDGGWPLATVKAEHEAWAESHQVWGVPTFIVGPAAAFVRLLEVPKDADDAITSVERILDLLNWTELNEFKHTSIPR